MREEKDGLLGRLRKQVQRNRYSKNPLLRASTLLLRTPFYVWQFATDGFYRSTILNRIFRPGQAHLTCNYTKMDRYPEIFGQVREYFAGRGLADSPDLRLLSFGCSTGEEAFSLRRYFPRPRSSAPTSRTGTSSRPRGQPGSAHRVHLLERREPGRQGPVRRHLLHGGAAPHGPPHGAGADPRKASTRSTNSTSRSASSTRCSTATACWWSTTATTGSATRRFFPAISHCPSTTANATWCQNTAATTGSSGRDRLPRPGLPQPSRRCLAGLARGCSRR